MSAMKKVNERLDTLKHERQIFLDRIDSIERGEFQPAKVLGAQECETMVRSIIAGYNVVIEEVEQILKWMEEDL